MPDPEANLPKAKQTTLGLYVTAKVAYEKCGMEGDPITCLLLGLQPPKNFRQHAVAGDVRHR